MKKKFILFSAIVAILLVSVLLVGCQASGSTTLTANTNQQTGISVSGQGIIYVTPDIVNIQLGIQAQASTVADAQSQAATAMTNVLAALTSNGVAKADVQTQNYNIQQITTYDNIKQQSIPAGYEVINYVNVKVRDITKTGIILDAVTAAGGDLTRVNSIQFSLNDPPRRTIRPGIRQWRMLNRRQRNWLPTPASNWAIPFPFPNRKYLR